MMGAQRSCRIAVKCQVMSEGFIFKLVVLVVG